MIELLLAFAAATQPPNRPIFIIRDPPQGPMPAENRTLSQPHRNQSPETTFPDLAVKSLRIDGDTLYVLVANTGGGRASGPIPVTARAEANGVRSEAPAARLAALKGKESRWVAIKGFSVKSAATARAAPVFALDGATLVEAAVSQPVAVATALDRSGQRRDDPADLNQSNNSLRAVGAAIARGKPLK